jgi:uncharacterized membrane protein (UPF0136 family)
LKQLVIVLAVGLAGMGAFLAVQSQRSGFFAEAEADFEAWRKAAKAGDAYEAERLRGKADDTLTALSVDYNRLLGFGLGLVVAGVAMAGLGLRALRSVPAGPPWRQVLGVIALCLGCTGAALSAAALVWMPEWADVERAVDEENARRPYYGSDTRAAAAAKVKHDELWATRNSISGTLDGLLPPALVVSFLGLVVGAVGYFRRWGSPYSCATGLAFFGLATAVAAATSLSGELTGLVVIGLAVIFAAVAVFLARGRKRAAATAAAPAPA